MQLSSLFRREDTLSSCQHSQKRNKSRSSYLSAAAAKRQEGEVGRDFVWIQTIDGFRPIAFPPIDL
jgi:hypothetical protein